MTDPAPAYPELYPWERQHRESAKAFDAFAIYRDMGPARRSIRAVARELGKSVTLIGRWSSNHTWVARAQAWDSSVAAEQEQEVREAVIAMNIRHARTGAAVLNKVVERLRDLNASEIRPSDIPRLMEVAARLERMARGEPSETFAEVQGIEGLAEGVEDAELARLVLRAAERETAARELAG